MKTLDVVGKIPRFMMLTSLTVFRKLATAAAWRTIALQPLEDAAGGLLRHIPYIDQVAAMAPRHGQGFNAKIQYEGLVKGMMSGAAEADQHLTKAGQLFAHSKALSWLFGEMDPAKRVEQSPMEALAGKRKIEPDTAAEIPGVLHAVMKDIPKMVEYEKSVMFRTKWYGDRGVDVTPPEMQEKIQSEAFQDALRVIFMQENKLLSKLNQYVRSLGEPDAKTGQISKGAKALQTFYKAAFPIVKIPSNIVAEMMDYVIPLPFRLLSVRSAIKKGIANLPPEQADAIMRQLKKGLVGNAIFLTGFLLMAHVGGYFQHGKKRDKDDVLAGDIRVGSADIPEWALHAPALLVLQAGATVARVWHSRLHKGDSEERGMGAGLLASALGIAEQLPFIRGSLNLSKLFDPAQQGSWIGESIKSRFEPALMTWLAKQMDKDANGEVVKRKTESAMDVIKSGIPGLRKTLDEKREPHGRRR